MSEETNIPKHWQIKKLGDVAEINPKIPNKENISDDLEIQFLPMKLVEEVVGKFHLTETRRFGEVKKGYTPFINDDVIFAKVTPCMENGKIAVVNNLKNKIGFGSSEFHVLRAAKDILSKYIFYFVVQDKFRHEAANEMTGAVGLRRVPKQFIENYFIPLPPLSEQQAIVFKIEELLSDLENGKQQLQIALQQLKIYRQSLLKCAFEGKLTKTLVPWKNVKFDEIANAIDPQPSHRTPPIAQNGIPFVSIKDFDSEADKIDFTNARRVSPDVLQEHLNRYKLGNGDFVIGKIGTIGKPVRIVLPQNYTLSANIVLIQPRKINATYLYYFFQSSLIEKAFTAGMNATTQAAFGIQKVRELRIELPNKEEQQHIVDELESKLTVCDKIEETIVQSLLQTESLRQSILKKAFEGKLVYESKNVIL